jgi:hypothetical protein
LDFFKHLPNRIHHPQQRRRTFRVKRELPVAQASQPVLSNMCYFFQLVETQEAVRALDDVNSAEDSCQRFAIMRVFLQTD